MIYLKLFFNKQREIRWRTKGWSVKLGISLRLTRAVGVERDNCQMWKGLNFAVTATVCRVRTCIQLKKNWWNKNRCLSWGKDIFPTAKDKIKLRNIWRICFECEIESLNQHHRKGCITRLGVWLALTVLHQSVKNKTEMLNDLFLDKT